MYEKFYVHKKILRTRNCRRRFIKNLLPEKRNENIYTKQPRFKSRLKNGTKSRNASLPIVGPSVGVPFQLWFSKIYINDTSDLI